MDTRFPTVLHIDDNDDARASLADVLALRGFDVWQAATAADAFLLAGRGPDVVVLDVVLPDLNGVDVCRRLKADPATAAVPVLLLSGKAVAPADQALGLAGGADVYLLKGVDLDVLIAQISALARVRRAERGRAASEARFRAIIERSLDAVILFGPDGRVRYATPSSARLMGYDPADLDGRNGFDFVHPDDAAPVAGAYAGLVREPNATAVVVYRVRHRAGGWRWLEARATNLLDEPAVRAVAVTFHDVSDRHRAERVVALQTEVLGAVVTGEPLGAVLDRLARGVEALADDLLCSILLLDGDRLRDGAGPSLPAAYRAAVDGTRVGPAAGSCGAAAHRRERVVVEDVAADPLWADHRELALAHGLRACWSTPVLAPDGRVLATFALYHRTPRGPRPEEAALVETATHLAAVVVEARAAEAARQRLEEQLRQAQKMEAVGRLAGGVAHDFNNLLTVIKRYGQLVRDALPEGEPNRELLDQVLKAGDRASDLTRQLLAYGRKQILQPRVVDLGGLVADLGGMLRRLIGEDVELALDAGPVRVLADPGQVSQAVMNLVVNARDAMPRGGRLGVRTGAVELAGGAAQDGTEVRPGRYALLRWPTPGPG
jgi:hypothetical protein